MDQKEYIKGSDGTGPASVATVQSSRLSGSTTIQVDTVQGINPAGFIGSMGTPHTFTDPITGETITVISEETAVDFKGHVETGNIEIDEIAPGFVDGGSEIGDIVIIRPTTLWADTVADVIDETVTTVEDAVDEIDTAIADAQSGWVDVGSLPSTITNLGNRSVQVVFNGVDLTNKLLQRVKLMFTRTVTAPTRCTDLESSSSQYFSKTSPAGLSFTTTYSCGAWIKLESYTSGGIIARRNADTEGWSFHVNTAGTLSLSALRIAANNKTITSKQVIPLDRWVHVAATMDVSAGDTSAQKIWIDGVEVPRTYAISGTITALVQGTTALVVGAMKSAGTLPFDGKIAQAFVASAQITQANLRNLYSQGITPAIIATNSIVSAYSFDNVLTDLNTTNANNLTASGGAVASATDSPFGQTWYGTPTGTTEWGIITNSTFSTNTTLTIQLPEGSAIPTSGGISALKYSIAAEPYGFIPDPDKWAVETRGLNASQSYSVSDVLYKVQTPTGAWKASYTQPIISTANASHSARSSVGLQTSSRNYIESYDGMNTQLTTGGVSNVITSNYKGFALIKTTTAIDLNLVLVSNTGSTAGYTQAGVYGEPKIVLEFGYL